MTAFRALVGVTLRGLFGRRRMLLLLLLAALPVIVGLVIRLGSGRPDVPGILDTLGIRTVLPLVALVIGTAVIGSETEDGTLVYLLTKPIARWRTALAKLLVAAGLTVVLAVPPIFLTGILVGGTSGESVGIAAGYAIAALVGGAAYAVVFATLGAYTSRALILGLAYTLLWEGVLAGLLEGTRFLSIRQATLGLAATLTDVDPGVDPLDPVVSIAILTAAIVGSFVLTTAALRRFEIRAGD